MKNLAGILARLRTKVEYEKAKANNANLNSSALVWLQEACRFKLVSSLLTMSEIQHFDTKKRGGSKQRVEGNSDSSLIECLMNRTLSGVQVGWK